MSSGNGRKKPQGCCLIHFQNNQSLKQRLAGFMIPESAECYSCWLDEYGEWGSLFLFTRLSPKGIISQKESFHPKWQLVTRWRGKIDRLVVKSQLSGPSWGLKQEAFLYYSLAHRGVWLISVFMSHRDVLVSLLILRTVWSVFPFLSGCTLCFLAASTPSCLLEPLQVQDCN